MLWAGAPHQLQLASFDPAAAVAWRPQLGQM
jgi:hypothetical protein